MAAICYMGEWSGVRTSFSNPAPAWTHWLRLPSPQVRVISTIVNTLLRFGAVPTSVCTEIGMLPTQCFHLAFTVAFCKSRQSPIQRLRARRLPGLFKDGMHFTYNGMAPFVGRLRSCKKGEAKYARSRIKAAQMSLAWNWVVKRRGQTL